MLEFRKKNFIKLNTTNIKSFKPSRKLNYKLIVSFKVEEIVKTNLY